MHSNKQVSVIGKWSLLIRKHRAFRDPPRSIMLIILPTNMRHCSKSPPISYAYINAQYFGR